ncbi:MAG: SH3 domain-containing protein [Dehalococcoidia bacterium]|nr:SH3 domain-containing protein [Dehalococcoidia bacterium]NUQ55525.1 SH3 domain-containing protein [Dehalococcoidia bacterium]
MSPHRPALAGFLLALLALGWAGVAARDATASQVPAGDLIVRTALSDEGTYQGQCWPWVQRVVFEATGFSIGWDYREGFFEAGATEVKLAEASRGDIVQIADDDNTAPDADYPGLHTAIVLENHGDGVLTVIDSNSQWDGIVRIRKGYTPAAAAARVGIDYHVYRFTGIPVPGGRTGNDGATAPPALPAAGTRPALKAGDTAMVSAQGDCLNLRWAPGTGNKVVACIADRSNLKVVGDPQFEEGRYWVRVLVNGLQGYVAGEFLEWVSSPSVPTSAGATGGPAPVLPFRAFVPMVSGD